MATKGKGKKKPEKLIKSDAAFQAFAAKKRDLTYYRLHLKEAQEKVATLRNELTAAEALVATYLSRLAALSIE